MSDTKKNSPKAQPYDPQQVEERLFKQWISNKYFEGQPNEDKKPYSIVIPPPNVTDILHLGHALNNTIQDILIRQKRMAGFEAEWTPGADHAGIATQVIVEKKLQKEGTTRRELGREKFIERTKEIAHTNKDYILNQLKKIGCSCDWDKSRFTLDESLSIAVKKVFIHLYDKGLVYKGHRIVNWCISCQTSLSDDEVDHEDKKSHLWYIKYKIKGSDQFLTVATTRPETMLGDTALAVNPKDERYKKFVGKTAILPILERELPIIADSYVDPEFGTGVVKITPAHDPNDFDIGKRHELEEVNILNNNGTLNSNAGKFKGQDRYEARKNLVKELDKKGHLDKTDDYDLSVGTCYRCHKEIEPFLSEQWFVKMSHLAKPAIEAAKQGKLRFHPDYWMKTYMHWMENIRDWCISRQLWWGHRIPVYYCDACNEMVVAENTPDKCPNCSKTEFTQDDDVLDTWFSSWLWPFSVYGWPEKNPLLDYFYPTKVLVTGSEIIFLWVARMVMAGYEFMGEIPFNDVYIHGTVRDANGIKMSKSLGNGIDPLEVINSYGADSLRISIVLATPDGQDPWISKNTFEIGRNFVNKMFQASRFVMMRSEGKKFDLNKLPKDLILVDRWILSRLERTIKLTNKYINEFKLSAAAKNLYSFTWNDFCSWYIELIKPDQPDQDIRDESLHVAFYVLDRILKLLHPFVPFATEEINGRIQKHFGLENETISFGPWPEETDNFIDDNLEKSFESIQTVVNAVRSIRAEMNVPPGKRSDLHMRITDKELGKLLEEYQKYFRSLAKINELHIGEDIKKPGLSASAVISGAELFVPLEGLINVDSERARLEKELQNLKNQLEKISKKLANQDFLKNAPEDVVERERGKKSDIEDRVEKLNANLEQLLGW